MTYSNPYRDLVAPAPEKYTNRAIFHERAAKAVTAKLQKMFGFTDEELTLPNTLPGGDIRTELATYCSQVLWLKKRVHTLADYHLPEETIAKIDEAAQGMMLRYMQAYYVRFRMPFPGHSSRPAQEPYAGFVAQACPQWSMCEIISNHAYLQAQAELCSMGFDEHTAHILNSGIIAASMVAFGKCAQDTECARIFPTVGGISGKSDIELAQNRKTMQSGWREENKKLHKKYDIYSATARGESHTDKLEQSPCQPSPQR